MPQSVWAAVIFWADLLADSWSLLSDCVRTGKPASQVRDPKIASRWSQDAEADSIFRAVRGTAPAEDYAPIAEAWDFSRAKGVADLGGAVDNDGRKCQGESQAAQGHAVQPIHRPSGGMITVSF